MYRRVLYAIKYDLQKLNPAEDKTIYFWHV